MDYVEEMLNLYRNVPEPPLFIKHDPEQFNKWVDWASDYRTDTTDTAYGRISPLGKEFDYFEDTIDSFIAYYDSLKIGLKVK